MNRRMIFSTVGKMLCAEAVMLLLPALVGLYYRESCVRALLISAAIALVLGLLAVRIFRPGTNVIFAREGFCIVALAWIALSAVGALPFVLSGEIPSYVDAFFETVSGFTTTGASILPNVEAMSNGLLFWRSFTHWVGGMGILVFVLAIVPSVSERSIHILRAEMPGPIVGKLVPRSRDTASLLYKIYIAMTLLQILLLLAGGMPPLESVLHTFGTAGTGGFGMKADSIAGYNPYLQWVITVFMFLFGVNFNLYYLLLMRRFRDVLHSTEFIVYGAIVLLSVGVVTANILPIYGDAETAVRLSAFQVSSIITTTGFATANFDLWPTFSKAVLVLLMFIGACAGSTGGGLKVSRVVILAKTVQKELKRLCHPRSVNAMRFEGKTLDETTNRSVLIYLAAYVFCFVAILLVLCFEQTDFVTNFTAAASCFNNIGPGLNAVGPAANYAHYSDLSKLTLSFAMLLGRLEIFPLLIFFAPGIWMQKSR
ncbi:MAG: TrkH family potassium uptake protein [Oscillospiraceae bacterium]|nr:TrkH family potassium uptake protein [Oscillospiraceae bacterium]MBR3850009.1 TrkH family potassium uptake protein [Oscillospiraceae bacterium]